MPMAAYVSAADAGLLQAQGRSSIPLPEHKRPGRLATGARLGGPARRHRHNWQHRTD